MLLSFENLTFSYGDNLILRSANLTLNEGERRALIGANGEGKTTLIKLIVGELSPDGGKITVKNGAKIGYLAQVGGYDSHNTVYEEMRGVLKEDFAAAEKLNELSLKLSSAEYGGKEYTALSAKMESLNRFISSRDSYNADVKIKTILNGMGFSGFYDRVINTLSGGEKTRLQLVKLLLEEPDLLILDEPTNHLDLATLFWLEDYLQTYKGSILAVSHDRYFLDRVCTSVTEIENKTVDTFTGNYTKYKTLKAEKTALLLKEYEAQQQEIAKLKDYVAKNIVRATTAKSAQSRVKQLNKMEELEKPYLPPRPPRYFFEYSQSPYESVLSSDKFRLEVGGKELIKEGSLYIKRGEKVALIGENGTGKSTLLKRIISGSKEFTLGRFVKIAYFDQEGLNLNPENTVLAELWERHVAATQTEIRSSLAAAGLFAEDMQKQVKSLSGGERAKLALCILCAEKGNFLILDEPTNHLDLPARESLERALKEFDGTLLFVSHDRYFIGALADRILEIEDKKLNSFEGNYEYYAAQKSALAAAQKEREEEQKYIERKNLQKESYRTKRERAEEAQKKERIKRTEERIAELEEEEAELNKKLADPKVCGDYIELENISRRLSEIKNLLDGLYIEYADMI